MRGVALNTDKWRRISEHPGEWRENWHTYVLGAIIVGVTFYISAKLGHALSFSPDNIAVFWPPNSIMLTALLLTHPRRWWIFFLAMLVAYFPAALNAGFSEQRATIFFIANCTEVLIAATALRRLLGVPPRFINLREAALFVVFAVLIAPFTSACIASFVTIYEPNVSFGLAFRVWFMGDSLAHLTFTPLLLTWIVSGMDGAKTGSWRHRIEVSLFTVILLIVGFYTFGGEIGSPGNLPVLVYTPLPLLLWSAVRFGPRGVWSTVFVITTLSIWYAVNDRGPFTSMATSENVLSLQLFLVAISIPILFLASLIQERKQIENHLRKLSIAVEQSPVNVIITDTHGTIEYVNPRFTEVTGYTKEEAIGRNPRILKSGKWPKQIYEELWETILAGKTWRGELENKKKNGERYWELASISPVRNAQGEVTHFLGVKEDITIRKQTEAQSRETEGRFRDLFESANDVILIADSQGNIIDINSQAEKLTGYSRRELLQSNVLKDLIIPEDRDKIVRVIHELIEGRSQMYNVRWQAKDGSVIVFEVSSSARLSEDGEFVSTRCILRNVTDRIRAEEDLRRAKESAEDATRAKSAFLANMSHEIRTPMTAILGFAENLLDSNLSESDKFECANTIRRNGESLLVIINDILDLSKIEAGKMEIEHIKCNPSQIITELASLMRVRTDAKNLALNIEYTGAIPETIMSDPTRLRQILINMISNAVKFTEDGSVTLGIRFIGATQDECAKSPKESYMQIDVLDTGIGMNDEQATTLFQPFTQADASTTRKYGGTGLGLTISKRFAELLGGEITLVESEIGVGSRFRVTVKTGPLEGVKMIEHPLSAVAVPDTISCVAQVAPYALKGFHILLAEDCPDNQKLISFILKNAGAEVTVEENGKLAYEKVLASMNRRRAGDPEQPFDVILMDMQMPVMDGYEATRKIRQKGYTGPIIALTAHAMEGDREKCIDAGCNDYATKPIEREKLIETIHNQLVPVESVAAMTTSSLPED